MFGKKKDSSIEMTKLSSLIAENVEVIGNVMFMDGLRMDGHVRGNVESKSGAKSLMVLSDKGSITGNVRTYDAVINGVIIGDLEVEHFLELQANARITGNITYRQLRMDCGASVDGKLLKIDEQGEQQVVAKLRSDFNPPAEVKSPKTNERSEQPKVDVRPLKVGEQSKIIELQNSTATS